MSVEFKWLYTLDGDPIVAFKELNIAEYCLIRNTYYDAVPDFVNLTRYDSKLIAFDSHGIVGVLTEENEGGGISILLENPDTGGPSKLLKLSLYWEQMYNKALYDEPGDGPIVGITTDEYMENPSLRSIRRLIENTFTGEK